MIENQCIKLAKDFAEVVWTPFLFMFSQQAVDTFVFSARVFAFISSPVYQVPSFGLNLLK
jgi:hypothetical protein